MRFIVPPPSVPPPAPRPRLRPGSAGLTRKVAPCPSSDSTEIVPPCISTMRFEIARPSPVPPFLRVFELSTCWNSPKILSWSSGAMPGPVSRTVSTKLPVLGRGADRDLAGIGEFDRVADEVQQDLRQAARVAMPGRQPGHDVGDEFESLCIGEAFGRADHRAHDIGHRIVFERQGQLPGLDLRQVEYVVDQGEEVLAVVLHPLEHALPRAAAVRHRCRRPSVRCSRGWRSMACAIRGSYWRGTAICARLPGPAARSCRRSRGRAARSGSPAPIGWRRPASAALSPRETRRPRCAAGSSRP